MKGFGAVEARRCKFKATTRWMAREGINESRQENRKHEKMTQVAREVGRGLCFTQMKLLGESREKRRGAEQLSLARTDCDSEWTADSRQQTAGFQSSSSIDSCSHAPCIALPCLAPCGEEQSLEETRQEQAEIQPFDAFCAYQRLSTAGFPGKGFFAGSTFNGDWEHQRPQHSFDVVLKRRGWRQHCIAFRGSGNDWTTAAFGRTSISP